MLVRGRPADTMPAVHGELAAVAQLLGYPPEDVAASSTVLIGTEDEIVETLLARREELGFSYWVLHRGDVEAFAPVVARLAGT